MLSPRLVLDNSKKIFNALHPKGIIFHELKLIYFAIPKVACTSIKNHLGRISNFDLPQFDEDFLPPYDQSVHVFQFPEVSQKDLYKYKDYTKFTVVRDPKARIVSCYKDKIHNFYDMTGRIHFGLRRYNKIFGSKIFYPKMDYHSFLKTISRIPDFLSDEHFRSQHRFLPVKGGKVQLDLVCKFESLGEHLDELTKISGVDMSGLEHRNSAKKRKQPVPGESGDLDKLIYRRFKKDYSILEYDNDLTPA